MSWRKIKLAEVIAHRKEFITIDNSVEYKRCRVQVNKKGVVLRDTIKGVLINTKKQQVCKAGDFLVAEIDAKVGGYGFVPGELEGAIVSSHYFLFDIDESKMLKDYLAWIIKTNILQDQISSKGSTNYAAIRPGHVLNFEIPLPAIDEQIELVKRLNKISKEYLSLEKELSQQQVHLQQLRKAILQDAVQGKLTKQNKDDEPADKLLNRIKAEKQLIVKAKKTKWEFPLHQKSRELPPLNLPSNWKWVRFWDVAWCYRGHNPSKSEFIDYPKNGYVRFIQITDFKTEDRAVYVPISKGLKYISKGEIIMAAYRHIGKLSRDMDGAFNVALCKITNIEPYNRNFLELVIKSDFVKGELLAASKRGHIPSMHSGHLLSLWIPVPPLSEQLRIVGKVQQLSFLLSQLEQQVAHSQTQASNLLQSVLKESFAGKVKAYEQNEILTMAAGE